MPTQDTQSAKQLLNRLIKEVDGFKKSIAAQNQSIKAQDAVINHADKIIRQSEAREELLFSSINEIKADVKELLESDKENRTKIIQLEGRMTNIERNQHDNSGQGMKLERIENNVGHLMDWRIEHKRNHDDDQRLAGQKNWQLWVLIITIALGGLSGWLLNMLQN